MTQTNKKIKAEIAIVKIGHILIEGLLLPDGSFGVAVPQIAELFGTSKNTVSRDLKRLLGEAFRPSKVATILGNQKINVVDLITFELIIAKLDRAGNKKAQDFRDDLVGVSLEKHFSKAFNIKFTDEDEQTRLKARQAGKVVRRTLTDAIQDFVNTHLTHLSTKEQSYVYANTTDIINQGVFNRKANQLKKDWECKNPRDEMNETELRWVLQAEELTMRIIDNDEIHPYLAAKEAVKRLMIPTVNR